MYCSTRRAPATRREPPLRSFLRTSLRPPCRRALFLRVLLLQLFLLDQLLFLRRLTGPSAHFRVTIKIARAVDEYFLHLGVIRKRIFVVDHQVRILAGLDR